MKNLKIKLQIIFLFIVLSINGQTNVQRVANALCAIPNNNYKAISFRGALKSNYYILNIYEMAASVSQRRITLKCYYDSKGDHSLCYEYSFDAKDTEVSEVNVGKERYFKVYCASGILERYIYEGRESSKKTITDFYFKSDIPLLYTRFGNGLLALIKAVRNPNVKVSTNFDNPPAGMTMRRTNGTIENYSPYSSPKTSFSSGKSGTYRVKYTTYDYYGKTALSNADITLNISNTRITAYNTKNGTKYWDVKYLGKTKLSKYNNFEFHKYYLTNKHVYFYISDKKVFSGPNNLKYYMIDFDGEIEFAL